MSLIGARVRPLGWEARTRGALPYAGDLEPRGVLAARILRSPYAHADIVALDVREARRLPGVRAVITAADLIAGRRYIHQGGALADRAPLAERVVRFVGEEVAAVAADTDAEADRALAAIRVTYRPRPAAFTIDEALRPGAPTLHDRPLGLGNVAARMHRRWGDPEGARAASTVSVQGTYGYPPIAHACMEPNVIVAAWDAARERADVWTSTQAPYFVAKEVAHALGVTPKQVICHEVAVGGGFGGKSKICEHEVIAVLLARAAGRPVRLALTRDEEFATTKTRHGFRIWLRIHADDTGHLRCFDGRMTVDNGAYNHSGPAVMSASLRELGTMYRPAGAEVEGLLVDTAKQPGGQFRGYGAAAVFALESHVDEVAARLGLDPIDLRLANANRPEETTLCGARLRSVRLVECLQAVRRELAWDAKRARRRPGHGVGVAAAMHVSGAYVYEHANESHAAVDLFDSGRVRVRFGGADPGTGQRTILAQVAAEELGVAIEDVDVLMMDGETTPFDMGSWSSRGTYMGGHAVRKASRELADRLRALAADKLGAAEVRLADGRAWATDADVAIGDLVLLSPDAAGGMLSVETAFVSEGVEMPTRPDGIANTSATYAFAAHAAEVEVDMTTGVVRVLEYVAAHDIGTAINPTLVEGQITGGSVMGLGAALGEELIHEQGRLVNGAYLNYALPRAADVPRIRAVLIEGGDPAGPYGAKNVGELAVTPAPAVIANAVYDAIGVRIRELPITPDKILNALAERQGRRRRHRLWRRPSRWWVSAVRWAYPRGLHGLLHRRATRALRQRAIPPVERIEAPRTLADLTRAAGPGRALLAGGTDLLVQRSQHLRAEPVLVAIGNVRELGAITRPPDGALEIGAAVTLARLADDVREAVPMVASAVDRIASPQIRAVATVAGNLAQDKRCWFFRNGFQCYKRSGALAPCYAVLGDHRFYHAVVGAHRCQAVTPSDLAAALMVFDAEVLIEGASPRSVPLETFYDGPGETVLGARDVIRGVRLPAPALSRTAAFEKLGLWDGDFAVVSAAVAARIDPRDGAWHDVRIVLGATAPTPWRARTTERFVEGRTVTGDEIARALDRELAARGHPLPGNAWKLDAASALVRRAAERMRSRP